jgi:nucleotide-binding universal stress UspA family protein
LVFSYNKILVPYDGSKPSENALQQAIQIVNDLLKCESETTNSMQDIQIILLHVIEEIHIRIPSLYFSLRLIAGNREGVLQGSI